MKAKDRVAEIEERHDAFMHWFNLNGGRLSAEAEDCAFLLSDNKVLREALERTQKCLRGQVHKANARVITALHYVDAALNREIEECEHSEASER